MSRQFSAGAAFWLGPNAPSSRVQMSRAAAPMAASPARREPDTRERAIAEICALAGKPERAAAYLASGKGSAEVLAELRQEQATVDRTTSGMARELARAGLKPATASATGRVRDVMMSSMERELIRAGLKPATASAPEPGTEASMLAAMRRAQARMHPQPTRS